jgi:DNA-binding CsgD family transcriptional regulator
METVRGPVEELTPREREVLELLRLGLTNTEIARRMQISTDGAKYHVSEIITKLGVRSRYEAAAWPRRLPWWMSAIAPVELFWRKLGWMPQLAAAIAAVAVAAGIGVLVWGLVRTNGDEGSSVVAPTATLLRTPTRPAAVFENPTSTETRPSAVETSTELPATGAIQGHVYEAGPDHTPQDKPLLIVRMDAPQPIALETYAPNGDPSQAPSTRSGPGVVRPDATGAYKVMDLTPGDYLVGSTEPPARYNDLPSKGLHISNGGVVSTILVFSAYVASDDTATFDVVFGGPATPTGPSRIKICVTSYDPATFAPAGPDTITSMDLQPANPAISVSLLDDGCALLEHVPAAMYEISYTTVRGFTDSRVDDIHGDEDGQMNLGIAPPEP